MCNVCVCFKCESVLLCDFSRVCDSVCLSVICICLCLCMCVRVCVCWWCGCECEFSVVCVSVSVPVSEGVCECVIVCFSV